MRSGGYSMRGRMLALLLGAVTVAWAAAAGFTYVDAQREIDSLLDAHLAQAARLVVAQAGRGAGEIDLDDRDGSRDDDHEDEPVRRYASVVAFQIWDRDGNLLLRSANAPEQRLSPVDSGFSDARLHGKHWRVYGARGERGRVLVQVAEDHATRDRIARGIALNSLLPLAITLPLVGLAVGWVVGRGTRPLRELGEELAERGPLDLAPVATRDVPREIEPLVDRLDGLFARIRESLAAERRFTSHAAHELRTPISAIRAQAEVARSTADPVVRDAALAHAIEACDRSARLMEQLLLLARVDEYDAAARQAVCDAADIARRVLAEAAPSAVAAGIVLGLDAAAPAPVRGDATLLEAALRNLVDNAVRYGVAGTEVRVGVDADPGGVFVVVEDDGPGVAEDDLARLGQRFQRGEGAAASGSGLGLSIVSSIAAVHGGSLELGRGERGRGFRATLRLPRPD